MMPKRWIALICALLFIPAFFTGSYPAHAQEDYDPQHTMLALNMAIVSVFNIVNTQDRIVLDQEYENIINNLKLGNIEDDYEIKGLYDELLHIISNTRLREDEKARFNEKYDRMEKEALIGALSGIRAYGGNAWNFLGSLLTSTVSSYFGYRDSVNQIHDELGDEMWRLRREQIEDFDDLQRRLLNSSWTLLGKYSLPDEYRITQRDLADFTKAVQEEDRSRSVRMLKVLEPNFKAYPTFWYFYGRAAMMNSDQELAEQCFREFERAWRPVLRQDPYKLEVAKHRAEGLVRSNAPREEIFDQLAIVAEHAPRFNWNAKLFLGVMAFTLGEKEQGVGYVEENIFFDVEKDLSEPILRSMKQGRLDTSQLGSELQAALKERAAREAERQKEDDLKRAENEEKSSEQLEVEKGLVAYFENRDEEAEKILAPIARNSRNPVAAHALGLLKLDSTGKLTNIPEGDALLKKRDDLLEEDSISNNAYAQSLPTIKKYAEEGKSRAQSLLGRIYEEGWGIHQDDHKAVEWYRKAAEQGYSSAQNNLGWMYEEGRGVPQDDRQAVEWYRKAAEQGYSTAQNNLGWMYEKGRGVLQDDRQAAEWYSKAAEQGYSLSQANLGWMYAEGRGIPQDDHKAVEWYRKAAEQGNSNAQNNLGWMYQEGRGVPQDDRKAVEWYRKAAEQGNSIAQNNLGVMYKDGKGVNKNFFEAYFWCYLALLNGNEDSQGVIDELEGKGVMNELTLNWGKLSKEEIQRAKRKAEQFYERQQNR